MKIKNGGEVLKYDIEINPPSSEQLVEWLSNSQIFSLSDIKTIVFDINITIMDLISQDYSQRETAEFVVSQIMQIDSTKMLIRKIFESRPYLMSGELPKPFKNREKIREDLTKLYVYLGVNELKDLLSKLEIEFSNLDRKQPFYDIVDDALLELERRNLTQNNKVLQFIAQLKKQKRLTKSRIPKIIKEYRKVPIVADQEVFIRLREILSSIEGSLIMEIAKVYDYKVVLCYEYTTIVEQATLLLNDANKKGKFNLLVSAIHSVLPNIGFPQYGIPEYVRQTKDILSLKYKKHDFPTQVRNHIDIARWISRNKAISQNNLEEISKMLGYKIEFKNKEQLSSSLSKMANSKSEIHLLFLAIEQLTEQEIPESLYKD